MGQLVDEIKPQYESKMNIIVVNLDKAEEEPVGVRFNVQYVPTLYLYDEDGREQNNLAGEVKKDVLTKELDKLVK
jgi:thioredoxin-like negative regulator of GroEL